MATCRPRGWHYVVEGCVGGIWKSLSLHSGLQSVRTRSSLACNRVFLVTYVSALLTVIGLKLGIALLHQFLALRYLVGGLHRDQALEGTYESPPNFYLNLVNEDFGNQSFKLKQLFQL